jgi:hypothetical protein
MVLTDFRAALNAELVLLTRQYDRRRLEHPALAPYESMAALFDEAKATKVGKTWVHTAEGDAIRCALVERYQRSQDRLWAALRLRVFLPMLSGIAKTLRGSDSEEQQSLLLECFHRAIGKVDPNRDPSRLSLFVYQKTRRPLFRALNKEIAWDEVGFGEEPEETPDPATVEAPVVTTAHAAGHKSDEATRQFLLESVAHRGALWQLVREQYGDLPRAEQVRIYRRLRQRRRRHLDALRKDRAAPTEARREPQNCKPQSVEGGLL